MQSLKISFEAVAPIFLLMLLGYVLKSVKITDKQGFNAVNKLVFNIFIPVLLFYNIYSCDTQEVFDLKLVLFAWGGTVAIFLIGYFLVLAISKENAVRGVVLQGLLRSNYAILGIPLATYVCGEGAGGLTSLMVAFVVPLFNLLAVVALERFKPGTEKVKLTELLKSVALNPLIIGCAVGVLFFATGIKLPFVIEESVSNVAAIASPLAIIILGAFFDFSGVKVHTKELIITVACRLIIVPAVMLLLAVAVGFRGESLACLLATFATPVATSSFAMAQQMGGDTDLASSLVVISSALCLVTLFCWIFILKLTGMF